MKIAVDLDGVVYEFQRTYRYMMRTYRGVSMPPVEEFWTHWDSPDAYTKPADRDWIWKEGVELGLFRYGHVVTGAIVGLRQLADDGNELFVVTHRPRQAVPDTLDWLSYIRIPWSEVHILSDGQPKTTVEAEVLIDDKVENCIDWQVEGRRTICYNRPWNEGGWFEGSAIRRAVDWPDVVRIVRGWEWLDRRAAEAILHSQERG